MLYREYITPEMQEKWFQKINNDRNFYFIIEYDGKEVGCVNIKDIDYEKSCGESGIFIYDDACLDSDVAVRATFCKDDFVWNVLKLKYQYSHVISSNSRASNFTKMFGYIAVSSADPNYYEIKREDALHPSKLIQRLKKILKNN